ncbi:hypothetical protein [Streptosporangium sandarakinum]|uniref:hypothetical protein n=1 Tax=Streptosporangium sandarakinum TaxID=1260955 RepID=UPI0015C90B90|nr:hypothetical protein [Streptosporangium sandarakinum]
MATAQDRTLEGWKYHLICSSSSCTGAVSARSGFQTRGGTFGEISHQDSPDQGRMAGRLPTVDDATIPAPDGILRIIEIKTVVEYEASTR